MSVDKRQFILFTAAWNTSGISGLGLERARLHRTPASLRELYLPPLPRSPQQLPQSTVREASTVRAHGKSDFLPGMGSEPIPVIAA